MADERSNANWSPSLLEQFNLLQSTEKDGRRTNGDRRHRPSPLDNQPSRPTLSLFFSPPSLSSRCDLLSLRAHRVDRERSSVFPSRSDVALPSEPHAVAKKVPLQRPSPRSPVLGRRQRPYGSSPLRCQSSGSLLLDTPLLAVDLEDLNDLYFLCCYSTVVRQCG